MEHHIMSQKEFEQAVDINTEIHYIGKYGCLLDEIKSLRTWLGIERSLRSGEPRALEYAIDETINRLNYILREENAEY